jgi:TonB family protein
MFMIRNTPRLLAVALSLVALAASLPAQERVDPFYEKLVADGKEAFESRDFEGAVKTFEVASFGFLDSPTRLLTCYVYLAVSYAELGNFERSDHYIREIRRRKLEPHVDTANLPEDLLKRCGLAGTEPAGNSAANDGRSGGSGAVKFGDLVPIEETDSPPLVLESAQPVYPPLAFRNGEEGEVTLYVLISESGEVTNIQIAPGSSTKMGFSQAAAAAVRQWKFSPATKNGVRVKVWKKITITFKLKD